jgi:hypothetical protein
VVVHKAGRAAHGGGEAVDVGGETEDPEALAVARSSPMWLVCRAAAASLVLVAAERWPFVHMHLLGLCALFSVCVQKKKKTKPKNTNKKKKKGVGIAI